MSLNGIEKVDESKSRDGIDRSAPAADGQPAARLKLTHLAQDLLAIQFLNRSAGDDPSLRLRDAQNGANAGLRFAEGHPLLARTLGIVADGGAATQPAPGDCLRALGRDNTVGKGERTLAQAVDFRAGADPYGRPLELTPAAMQGLHPNNIVRELDDAHAKPIERQEPVVEIKKKPDGSTIETVNGLVHEIKNGDNSTKIEYQLDANHHVKFDTDGKPLVERIESTVGGKTSVIDLGADTPDNAQLRELGKRIYVSQTGDSLGNISIVADDRKSISQLSTEFSTITHELGTKADGTAYARISSVLQADGSSTQFKYQNDTDPTRATHISERIQKTIGDGVITRESDRVNNTEKFITRDDKGNISWNDGMKAGDDGKLRYKELVDTYTDIPLEKLMYGGFSAAKDDFVRVAAANGVFKGNKELIKDWVNRFDRQVHHWRDKGWKAASDKEMIETMQNLTRVFTDPITGKATKLSRGERRLAVETSLKEIADSEKWINQGNVGTCGINSAEEQCNRRPQDITRWVRQAMTTGHVTSKGADKNGHHKVIELTDQQLHYSPVFGRTYANQIFQFSCLSALGFRSTGGDFGGTTNDDIRYCYSLCTGQKANPIDDTWMGGGISKSAAIKALKTKGSFCMIEPGHAMAIRDYDAKTGKFLLNNWWAQDNSNSGKDKGTAGPRDGWYSPGQLGIRA